MTRADHATADIASAGDQGRQHDSLRERLAAWVHELEHVLPSQAPIRDFVHHNTLHGFQHLVFPQALAEAHRQTGSHAYLSEESFRAIHAGGRIERADLEAALREQGGIDPAEVLLQLDSGPLTRIEVQLAVLLHRCAPLSAAQLRWQVEECGALRRLQPDVPAPVRQRLLASARRHGADGEARAVAELWAALLDLLGIDPVFRHPEELLERQTQGDDPADARQSAWADQARHLWQALSDRLGRDWTLRSLLLALSGEDVLDRLRPTLIRHLGAHLDQGLAGWHNPGRGRGFYAAWLESASRDLAWALGDLAEVRREIAQLPTEPLAAIIHAFGTLGLEESRWQGYLERLALELPGWSGMFLWRHLHPGYGGSAGVPIDMLDYLAVRLAAERLVARDLVRRHWGVALGLAQLQAHFESNPAELYVRHGYFQAELPEYLADLVEQRLAQGRDSSLAENPATWARLARQMQQVLEVPAPQRTAEHGATRVAWPLFRLCQHLGVDGGQVRAAGLVGVEALLLALGRFDRNQTGWIWLNAYERRYREQVFAALSANHGRWQEHAAAPAAQLVFCMDDREEGMRRHLEEIAPAVETLGAAAHFGVFQNWRGLDDEQVTPLCPVVPVVVKPAHEVREVARAGAEEVLALHRRRRHLRLSWKERLYQGTRRGLLAAPLLAAAAPAALAVLLTKSLAPRRHGGLVAALRTAFDRSVPTRLFLTAADDAPAASPEQPRLGFTDAEQAERVGPFLRAMGLTANFAPLVVILGHGSDSENNPHLSAYDCGACAGRHSGPNARLFAAMANRRPVRAILAERGLEIPDGTWFVGAEHNTCDDAVTWYDVEDIPSTLQPAFAGLAEALAQASRAHAAERCRRFASAPAGIGALRAQHHVLGRRYDFSQARPELGHATNACALIGRRRMSRGAFFDRRAFLISYDPKQDADGTILERLLLANGPVGAGISLEYYFSTVNNEQFGCGTKIVHNLTGQFGVMEGASSDLRTGLPRQMIEIHEPMRLLVVVEQNLDVITAIYRRQPPLQELIGKGWIVVAAKDPDSPAIHLFDPDQGWLRWAGAAAPPTVERSELWFAGKRDPLPPALLERAVAAGA